MPVNAAWAMHMDDLFERDRQAREWIADPHRFFKAFSRTARRFQHQHPSARLRTMTLVGTPDEFLARRPLQFHAWEETVRVKSWEQVLSTVVAAVAMRQPRLLLDLDRAGLVPWMAKQDPGQDLIQALQASRVTLKLDSLAEAFRMTQWLLLMAGVKLNEAVVQVDPFSDEEWAVREAQLQEKRAEEKRVLREIDLARKQWADAHPEATPGCEDGANWTPESFTF